MFVTAALVNTLHAQTSADHTRATFLRRGGYTAISLTPAPEYGDGQYTVQTTLNVTPAALLFDSGFDGMLTIHQEQADAAGLRGLSAGRVEGITGTSSTDTARLKTFGIDSLQFGPQTVSIGTFPMADGAIGAYFMSTHGTIIDYEHGLVYLQTRPKSGKSGMSADALKRSGDVVIPIKHARGKGERAGYYVQALVNGNPRLFLLDTGWGGSALNLDASRAAAFGLSDPARGTFKLGTIAIDTDFTLVDLSAVRKKQASVGMLPLDGVIGCAFLKEHAAIIDFAKDIMYLRP